MAIKVIYEVDTDIPEALKEHSKQEKLPVIDVAGKKTLVDKWVVDVEDIDTHPKIMSLKNAYKAEQDKRKKQSETLAELEEKVKAIPEDFDAEKWATLKDIKPGDADKQRQELRASLEAQFKKEKDALTADLQKKDQFIEKTVKQDRLREGLVLAGIESKHVPVVMAYLLPRVKIKQVGDDFNDLVDTDMGPLTAKEYALQWVQTDEGKVYVKPPEGPDLDGNKNRRSTGEKNPWAKETFNMTEQARLIKSDPVKAERLKAAVQGLKK